MLSIVYTDIDELQIEWISNEGGFPAGKDMEFQLIEKIIKLK